MPRRATYNPRLPSGNVPFPTGIRRITGKVTWRKAQPRFSKGFSTGRR